MSINKANWLTDNSNMRFSMPISKVDKERRIVSGFATLDNVDKQGDIVPSDASVKAFERFRGNIREMHQPIAVGKMVSFKSDKYYDKEEDKFFSGVYVSAYISKGAQDTWEKILDGTLSGFSIGGSIRDAEDMYDEKMDKSIRVIKDYDLTELSLVDNPANQFANILSIQKNSDGTTTMDGIISKMELENVYWCGTDDLVNVSSANDASCPVCEKHMQNIGFVETTDVEKADMIKKMLAKFKKASVVNNGDDANIDASIIKNTATDHAESDAENLAKEGIVVADEQVETVEEVIEETVEKSADSDTDVTETVEKSDEVQEETVEEIVEKSEDAADPAVEKDADLAKAIDDLKATVAENASLNNEKITELLSVVKSLAEGMTAVSGRVESLEDGLNKFDSRVDAVEADTAVRKSGDLGGVVQLETQVKKSVWGGRFLNSADLYR